MKHIFLLVALCCLSGEPAGNPSPATTAGSAAIQEKKGRQFELQGQLASHLGVRLTRVFSAVTLSNAYRPFRLNTLTDLSGRFKFKKVPEGTYILTVSIPRKRTSTRTIEMTPSFADSKNRIRVTVLVSAAGNREPHQISVAELAVPNKARRAYAKAQNKLARGRTEAAVKHLKRALSLAPAFPTALNSLGTILFQTGKYEEARKYFEKALEHDPAAYSPLVNLAGALASLGLFEEALEINLQAAQYRPLDPLVHAQLGSLLWSPGAAE